MVYTKRQSYLHLLVIVLLILTSFAISQPTAQAAGTFRVTTTEDTSIPSDCDGDPNFCSLRQAINSANASPGSTIEFFIPDSDANYIDYGTSAAWFITPDTPLPGLVAGTITIDGSTQTANVGNRNIFGPEIIISGTVAISNTAGLTILSDGNTVRNLGIVNFTGENLRGLGIEIGGDNNIIQGNYIGVSLNASGPIAVGNGDAGILVRETASGNIIGGDHALETTRFNVIAGNINDGIIIDGGDNNIIQGNYIGIAPNLEASGYTLLPNGGSGVQLRNSADGNRIGPPSDASNAVLRNFIGGNDEYGIYIKDSKNNEVYGNFIGIDPIGKKRVPNGDGGIIIDGPLGSAQTPSASGNVIGASGTFANNYIAGNGGPGIHLRSPGTSGNTVLGNYVGVGSDNKVPSGSGDNNTYGIFIENGASQNVIGASRALDDEDYIGANFIAGNSDGGIYIKGRRSVPTINEPSNNNIIKGNCIGLAPSVSPPFPQVCLAAIANEGDGIKIDTNSQGNEIGGDTDAERNLIGNNTGNGIYITGPAVVYNPPDTISYVSANKIYSNDVFSNTLNGIFIENAQDTVVQGEDEESALNITINAQNGIRLFNGFNTAISNFSILDNDQSGITVTGSVTTTIQSGEVMTHTLDGIVLIASDVNSIQSVRIESNQGNGITATGTTTTTIQSSTVLSNSLDGIATNNSNVTAINRTTVQWNDGDGVQVSSDAFPYSRDVYITQNTLSRNGGYGVRANKTTPGIVERVRITSNSISRNTAGGIDLDPATDQPGVSANPNHDIDPPITNLSSPLRLRVNEQGLLTGYVYTSTDKVNINPPGACVTCTIQIFRTDPTLTTPDGQGYELIGEATADEVGRFQDQINLTNGSLPPQILLTATDGYGNTSEFTAFTRSYGLEIVAEDPDPPEQDAAPGQTVTYTFRLTNTGTVDLTDLNLSADSSLDWTYALSPTTTFELPAADAMIVTMTLTLPTGSAENVRAGVQDQTRVTASSASIVTATDSITATTTVLEKFVLSVDPLSRSGRGAPEDQLTYVHKITNTGNVIGTVEITGTTRADGLAVPDPDWNPNTIIAPTTMTLGPGESTDLLVQVTIPDDSAEGISRVTRVELTVPSTPSENKVISDTTTVDLELLASMVQNEQGDAAAGEQISFEHVVTNLSNGTAPFRLNASSSLGSTISFRSNTSGINLTDTDTFSVSNVLGDNTFNFYIDITVNLSALKGEEDRVTVFLTDVEGNVIGGASVTDRINVTRSAVAPRLWLPLVFR